MFHQLRPVTMLHMYKSHTNWINIDETIYIFNRNDIHIYKSRSWEPQPNIIITIMHLHDSINNTQPATMD